MNDQATPAEETVLTTVIVLVGISSLLALGRWIMGAAVRPDPWHGDPDVNPDSQEAHPLCTRCLSQLEETDWFCAACGKAAAPTTNMMPFLESLSLGDVLRQGTDGRFRKNPLSVAGYIVLSVTQYWIFAPVYWWRLYRNIRRQNALEHSGSEQTSEND